MCLALAVLAASCTTPKHLSYLLDMDVDVPYGAPQPPELRISPEDVLGIRVLSEDVQLAAPFNTAIGTPDGSASATATVSYLVDRNGCIEFPVLGLLRVEGCTLKETEAMIAARIREQGFIKDPVVHATLDNFRVPDGFAGRSDGLAEGLHRYILFLCPVSFGSSPARRGPGRGVTKCLKYLQFSLSTAWRPLLSVA